MDATKKREFVPEHVVMVSMVKLASRLVQAVTIVNKLLESARLVEIDIMGKVANLNAMKTV